eukprot:Nk52_evm5s321 gene=Nk52_evmTU5s321
MCSGESNGGGSYASAAKRTTSAVLNQGWARQWRNCQLKTSVIGEEENQEAVLAVLLPRGLQMRDTDVEQAVTEELCRLVRTAVASEKVNAEESRHEKIHSVKVAYEKVGNTTSRMVLISMDEGCLARTFRQSYILIQNMRMKILKHIRGKWADIQKLQVAGVSDELTDTQLQEAFEEFGEVVEVSREVTTTDSDESFMDSFRNIKSGRLRVFISNKGKKELPHEINVEQTVLKIYLANACGKCGKQGHRTDKCNSPIVCRRCHKK